MINPNNYITVYEDWLASIQSGTPIILPIPSDLHHRDFRQKIYDLLRPLKKDPTFFGGRFAPLSLLSISLVRRSEGSEATAFRLTYDPLSSSSSGRKNIFIQSKTTTAAPLATPAGTIKTFIEEPLPEWRVMLNKIKTDFFNALDSSPDSPSVIFPITLPSDLRDSSLRTEYHKSIRDHLGLDCGFVLDPSNPRQVKLFHHNEQRNLFTYHLEVWTDQLNSNP